MPPPLDLAGQRFGRLLVVRRASDIVSASGKTVHPGWLCRCDCGREEVVMQKRLPYCASNARRRDAAQACAHCRAQRACIVCGRPFVSTHYRTTCSDDCDVLRRRAIDLEFYRRRVAEDPDYNRNVRAQRNARAAADPEYARHLAEQRARQDASKRARILADPERREHYAFMARRRYAADPEAQAKRRAARAARMAAMTPQQYAAWSARAREYSRKYAERARSTPEGRERYQGYMREYLRQQALRGLTAAGDELIKRSLPDE